MGTKGQAGNTVSHVLIWPDRESNRVHRLRWWCITSPTWSCLGYILRLDLDSSIMFTI